MHTMASNAHRDRRYRRVAPAIALIALALVVHGVLLGRMRANAPARPVSGTDTAFAYLPLVIDLNRPTATATPTRVPQPDLIITDMVMTLETGGACDYPSTALGLRVWFANIGDAPARPFVVEANGAQQTVAEGLDAGATGGLWFSDYQYAQENTVIVDATHLINESNETNNRRSEHVPVPTLPPTCTPTSGTPSARSSAPTPSRTFSPARAIDTPIAYLPVIAWSDTPTPTPTGVPVPPKLEDPADGALLPQPVPPAAWVFTWEALCACYYTIDITGPGDRQIVSAAMRDIYVYTTTAYLPNDALRPWHWRVYTSRNGFSAYGETRTFWVAPAPTAAPTAGTPALPPTPTPPPTLVLPQRGG
jgi:hypothetical protein